MGEINKYFDDLDENFNPFEEEFEKDNIAPSLSDRELNEQFNKVKSSQFEETTDEFFESITNYDEELEKQKNFKPYYSTSDDEYNEQAELQKNFKDFLILRKISGSQKSLSNKNKLPSDAIKISNEIIEIQSLNDVQENEHKASHIITHKDNQGNIKTIEVICQCGVRTVIKLEYE